MSIQVKENDNFNLISKEILGDKNILKYIFGLFYDSSICYCVLRGYDELNSQFKNLEVDILVKSDHLKETTKILKKIGFLKIPSWGYIPHHFYIFFDHNRRSWLKLDVVTDLCYGNPFRKYYINFAKTCLKQKEKYQFTFKLSYVNEFITLFLHCLLDKEEFNQKNRDRLIFLKNKIVVNPVLTSQIKEKIQNTLSSKLNWFLIEDRINRYDWDSFFSLREQLITELKQCDFFKIQWRHFKNRSLLFIRPLLFSIFSRGISVALLAPDGAGKSTVARRISESKLLRVRVIYMGTNIESSNINLPASRWLKKKVKSRKNYKKNLLSFVLRFLNYSFRLVEQWLRYGVAHYHKFLGRCVIFDRYTYDSHLAPKAKSLGKRIRRKLLTILCPNPNLVILLDAPGTVLYERKKEHSPEILEKQRKIFHSLKDKIQNMKIVNVERDLDDVIGDVTLLIWLCYTNRLFKKSK